MLTFRQDKSFLLPIACVFAAGILGLPQLSAQEPVIQSARVLGLNSPIGTAYDQEFTFDETAESVADGSIVITERLFGIDDRSAWVEVAFDSTSGAFVDAPDNGRWFANFRLAFENVSTYDTLYFFFTNNGTPIDFNTNFRTTIPHPFDNTLGDVNTSGGSFGGRNNDQQFGNFSVPFSDLTSRVGIDPNEITGYVAGVRVTTVPEPTTAGVLTLLFGVGVMRRRSRGITM
jgi:hypothetical protein